MKRPTKKSKSNSKTKPKSIKTKCIKIKQNPHLHNIKDYIKTNSTEFKYLNKGTEAFVYIFKTSIPLFLKTENLTNSNLQPLKIQTLKPGEYILKEYRLSAGGENFYLKDFQIKTLIILSKYGIIPEIYIINKTYSIMKYIKGRTLYDLLFEFDHEDPIIKKIEEKAEKLFNIIIEINKKEFFTNEKILFGADTYSTNILVSEDFKHVWIIDPWIMSGK